MKVIDVCCGGRMMWFDKNYKEAVFNDIRSECHDLTNDQHIEIRPDTMHDFKNLPYSN